MQPLLDKYRNTMYNITTENVIRNIPTINGIDKERLPQLLTQKYARIISLKTRYETGVIQFNNEELKSDWQELNTIANTLELYLIADKTEATKEKESIAYVAAVSRKLMSMIQKGENLDDLSLYFVPEDLLSAILFIISGNLPDAQEVADNFDIDNIANQYKKWFYIAIQGLIKGKLGRVVDIKLEELDRQINIWEYATQLVWRELFYGVQQLCDRLLNGTVYHNEHFLKIEELSSESLNYEHYKDIYDGAILLSKLLQLAANQLSRHALIDVASPQGVLREDWMQVIRRQASIRPYLWDNHIEGINKGILNPGISSIITFPTGAGKTTLTELKIVSTLLCNKRIIYIVPTHALENQVNLNLQRLVDRVVPIVGNVDGEFVMTDDENEEQIMVMTPEHCLTVIRTSPEKLEDIRLVVFDEFHLIHGDATDTRAIDAMILVTMLLDLLPSADYCFISAMVQNGQEIAEWIQTRTGRDCILLDNPWKPTSQLQGCLLYNKTAIEHLEDDIRQTKVLKANAKTPPTALNKRMVVQPQCLFSLKALWDTMEVSNYYSTNILDHPISLTVGKSKNGTWYLSSNFNSVAAELALKFSSINQKTIVFALNPRFANSICTQVCKNAEEDRSELFAKRNNEVENIALELGGWDNSYIYMCNYATLHHSHLLPEERVLSEWFFKQSDGAMVMVATPTIAQGINLPADIVLIAGSSRYDQQTQGQERIEAHEILNAAGRAGRAGFRSHGTAILIPSKIIKMENNSINNIWVELREEVFSKGDRCLVINDPIGNFMTDTQVQNDMVNRFQGSKESVTKYLQKSLYAYQMQKKGEEETFQKMLDNFVNNLPTSENMSLVQSVAEKTGIDENTTSQLFERIPDDQILDIIQMAASDLLHCYTSILSTNTDIFSMLFHSNIVEEQAKKLVGLSADAVWTTDAIISLFNLVHMYIKGCNYEEIDTKCCCKKKDFVDNARIFVLRVIPEISYMCGVFVQVVLAKIEEHGAELELSKDFKSFASCIKEGVLNHDMLMAKYKNKWMRVECHQKYRNN